MMFRTMEVLKWVELECKRYGVGTEDFHRCCYLVSEVQAKNGNEHDACLAVRKWLEDHYPKQESLSLNQP